MVEDLKQRILKQVTDQDYQPQSLEQLAQVIGIGDRQYGEYRDAVKALHRKGRVVIGAREIVLPPVPPGRIIGTYRGNPRGFGFIIPETPSTHGDLFVAPGDQLDAVTGDTVLARVLKRGKREGAMRLAGRVDRILQRGNSRFVGGLRHVAGRWFVVPDGNTLHVPIFIKDAGAKQISSNAQVVVEIIQYPGEDTEAQGVIVEVLGERGQPQVDRLSIIHQYHLPHEFPEECLAEARRQAQSYLSKGAPADRVDLTRETIVTIDPDDARDFDDAISLEQQEDCWQLGVHIADVSRFVPAGGALDAEASRRGNSIYLPGYVIPMLPETLSNGVCSLQEGEPRLVKSAFITYDRDGHVIDQRFDNSVIRSTRRLTYREATSILEGKTGGFGTAVVDVVRRMEQLARIIRKRRFTEGMISLDIPGVELILDEQGRAVDVQPEDQSFSHTIIEMFMVEANEAAARLLTRLQVPHLRRIHPEPEPTALEELSIYLKAMAGGALRGLDRKALQATLDAVQGKPQAYAVNLAILRSMQQAEYSPQLIGHYALASKHYAHFTSPIRRYPDLTVHRLLQQYIARKLENAADRRDVPSTEALRTLGAECSFTERRAEDAERELRLVLLLRMLMDHIGETVKGIVSGVTNFGVFVQLHQYLVEGLIRFDVLPDDWWEVVPQSGCIVGQRSRRRISIGDEVLVSIAHIDIPARQMDLLLVEQLTTRKPIQTDRKKKTAKRQRKNSASKHKKRARKKRRHSR